MVTKKLGVTEWYLPVSGPSAVRLCKKLGFDGMEMTDLGGSERNYPLLDERVEELFQEELDATDFMIYTLHPLEIARKPGIQFDMKSSVGQETLKIYKKSVETCVRYHIPTIMLASFAGSKFQNSYELGQTIRTLSEYGKIAEGHGVRLIYEGFSDTETMLRIREGIGNVKLCYDLANPYLFGFSEPKKDMAAFGKDWIDCIHVKDINEKMNRTCLLGEGVAGVAQSLKWVGHMGFDGWYFLETHYNEMPIADMGHGLDALLADAAFVREYWQV